MFNNMANFAFVFAVVVCMQISNINGQENIQTVVAKSLAECYNNSDIVQRDNKLPMTLPVLLDLIRKIEDGPDKLDLSAIAVSMLQRFRQDGIIKPYGVDESSLNKGVLMYSPNYRFTNDKFKLVLKYMVPGNALRFPNETLTVVERCTLHAMMSSSIEGWERKDEARVCKKLGKYQRRVRRSPKHALPDDDAELIDVKGVSGQKGNIQANPDAERIAKNQYPPSECPVETGVIYTQWGAVSAGTLIAGIAAGAQPDQNINLRDIAKNDNSNKKIDNIWGATIAGDLAEAAIYYREEDTNGKIEIGAEGGWNSTTEPHWYFVHKPTQLFFTDAEIRGGLDGLILGKLYRDKFSRSLPSLKLSQLIEMYYTRGVFDERLRACQRRELLKEFAPHDEMEEQTEAFAIVLNKKVRLQFSYDEEAVTNQVREAVQSLEEYIPRLNDPTCMVYTAGDRSTASTDMFIAIDTQWDFTEIKSILNSIISGLPINPTTGNYTIINAYDGSIMINSSNSIIDLHSINQTVYDNAPRGIDMTKTIRQIEELTKMLMENEKSASAGGRSVTALLILSQETKVDEYIVNRIRDYINIFTPDLKLFVLTKGDKAVYANIVKDASRDVISYTSNGASLDATQMDPLIDRVKEVPRRIINPKCGADWKDTSKSNVQLNQNILPSTINYYRIHPNYFFGEGTKAIKIKGAGAESLTVCYSRSNIQPRANQSAANSGDVDCKPTAGQEISISLTDACKDKTFIHDCVPLYFSVEAAKSNAETATFTCTDPECPAPDAIKFTILGENLGCESSALMLAANLLVYLSIITTLLYKSI